MRTIREFRPAGTDAMDGPGSIRYEWNWGDWRTASDFHRNYLAWQAEKHAWRSFLKKVALLAAVAAVGLFLLPRRMPTGSKWLVIFGVVVMAYYAWAYLSWIFVAIQWVKYRRQVRSMAGLSRWVEWASPTPNALWFRSEPDRNNLPLAPSHDDRRRSLLHPLLSRR